MLIALGANLPGPAGGPADMVRHVLPRLFTPEIAITAVSRLYASPAFPPGSGPDFINAVARYATNLPAQSVLDHLHAVEKSLGRDRKDRWAPRSIDLDLIDHGGAILPDLAGYTAWEQLPQDEQRAKVPDEMILPHPRLADRAFVLLPLRDVAPDWHHPVSGQGIDALIARLDSADIAATKPLTEPASNA